MQSSSFKNKNAFCLVVLQKAFSTVGKISVAQCCSMTSDLQCSLLGPVFISALLSCVNSPSPFTHPLTHTGHSPHTANTHKHTTYQTHSLLTTHTHAHTPSLLCKASGKAAFLADTAWSGGQSPPSTASHLPCSQKSRSQPVRGPESQTSLPPALHKQLRGKPQQRSSRTPLPTQPLPQTQPLPSF